MLQTVRNYLAQLLQNRGTAPAEFAPSGSLGDHDSDPAMLLGNPLRSLSPVQAVSILEQGMRGEWTRAQWLMRYVELLDADVYTIVDRRLSGLRELDWTIRTDSKADERGLARLAAQQRDALTAWYSQVDNMREAVEHLATAKFRAYAHLAIGEDGSIENCRHLEPLDQWWWLRNGMYGGWHWNPRAKAVTAAAAGDPVDGALYIIREEPRPLIWLAILKYLRAHYNQKWWDRFLEISARRGIVVIAPEGIQGQAGAEFTTHAQNIAAGNSGWLPAGSSTQTTGPDAQAGTQTVWEARLRFMREELILAGTGGLLTALSQATGIGSSQGEEQGNVWRSLLRADARDISEVFQEQLDKRFLAARFPGKPILAWFELDTSEQPSTDKVLDHAVKAAQAGYEIDPDELSEKTGYTLTRKPPPPAMPAFGGAAASAWSDKSDGSDKSDSDDRELANRAERRRARGLRNRADASPLRVTVPELVAPESWAAPVREFMSAMEARASDPAVTDADFLAWVRAESARLPELAKSMDVEGLAQALATGMQRAVEETLEVAGG